MWKWIIGVVVLIVLLIGSGIWYGFRKMSQFASGDSTVTMTIGGTPDRVFASIASGDSIGDWMVGGGKVRSTRGGLLRSGDTLYIDDTGSEQVPAERLATKEGDTTTAAPVRKMAWVVGDVTPGKAIALRLVADTMNVVAILRRYTVMAQGDSTVVFSTVTSPMMDSVRRAESKGGGSAMMEFTAKMMVGVMRMQNQMELKQLKAHVEGTNALPELAPSKPDARSKP